MTKHHAATSSPASSSPATPSPSVRAGHDKRRRQSGWGLVEALVCSLVLSTGMVLLLKGQAALRAHSDFARDRSAAAVLAEAQVERLRAQVPDAPPAHVPEAGMRPVDSEGRTADTALRSAPFALDRAGRASAARTLQDDWQLTLDNTSYAFHQQLTGDDAGPLRDLDLQVRWQDRSGAWQPLHWPARLTPRQPLLALVALSRPPAGDVLLSAGRHAAVPTSARALGDGWAVFQPEPGVTLAWLLDIRTGRVQGLCELGDRSVDDLRDADVAGCRALMAAGGAWLISGQIRFDLSTTPSAEAPRSPALPGGVTIALQNDPNPTTPPRCASNAAEAAAQGRGVVSYHCLVPPRRRDGRWSGRTELTGMMADLKRHRVCRYTADYDQDGRISNLEHPDRYADVDSPLLQQNFLVIRAELPCPAGRPADSRLGRLLDATTLPHQPSE
ncbi:hypothetical protein QRD43_21545 [Pelomonas sp. APW6]|uniref:Uncharacterized protein n=1 Tax=Roseateles subflavus TaxID=3053353 RepID=A0ABT7LNV2_9BURK|nr:hypothetical protein [Pelomonas sp. APW6]MDL5034503.1 hypothetical protein [Pelomonas sp. APW6]